MRRILTSTMIALVCAATVPAQTAITGTGRASAGEAELTGKWQGTTPSGRRLMLDLKVDGQQLSGHLSLGEQTAEIIQGEVEGQTFSMTAGALEGRAIVADGRLVGEDIELTVQGVASPLTLKRVK